MNPVTQERFGRFYTQELINRGGMAEIWLVTDSRGKPYALRKLNDRLRFQFAGPPPVFARVRGCFPKSMKAIMSSAMWSMAGRAERFTWSWITSKRRI